MEIFNTPGSLASLPLKAMMGLELLLSFWDSGYFQGKLAVKLPFRGKLACIDPSSISGSNIWRQAQSTNRIPGSRTVDESFEIREKTTSWLRLVVYPIIYDGF